MKLPTINDVKGSLTVIEKLLPFDIKRVYYMYGLNDEVRGKHRHKKMQQLLLPIVGECRVFCDNGEEQETFELKKPDEGLYIPPEDWHTMSNFSDNTVILVLASTNYDADDYIWEPYNR